MKQLAREILGLADDGMEACPVCRAGAEPFLTVGGRDYWACRTCGARFVDSCQRPSREDELEHYHHHENEPSDPRYRRFLSRLAEPLLARLPAPSTGLDYGCGPGPALAAMLRQAGHEVALYDPFFVPDKAALERSYDFVACSETVEHFHRPQRSSRD